MLRDASLHAHVEDESMYESFEVDGKFFLQRKDEEDFHEEKRRKLNSEG